MTPSTITPEQRQAIQPMRQQLLDLHKILLDHERARYEQQNGGVVSRKDYLDLVLSHPQFEWLRQLSGMIVQLDETLAPRNMAAADDLTAILQGLRILLAPVEEGPPFQSNYWHAIQDSPDILLAHGEIRRLLK